MKILGFWRNSRVQRQFLLSSALAFLLVATTALRANAQATGGGAGCTGFLCGPYAAIVAVPAFADAVPIFNLIYIVIQAVIVFGLGFLALRAVLLYQREEDFQKPLIQMVGIVVALLATNFVAGWVIG